MITRSTPAPKPPKSGWKRVLLWIVGALAVVTLIPVAALYLFLGALSHSVDEQGKKASAADDLEQLLHPGYQIGEVVPVGDVDPYQPQPSTLQVTSFTCGKSIGSTGTPIAGGPFCTVAVTMANTSTEDHVFDLPQYLEAVRGDGTSSRMNSVATNAANRDPKSYTQVVHPGQSMHARLLFDATDASRPIVAIVLNPSRLTEYPAGVDFTLTDEERKRALPMQTAVPWQDPTPTDGTTPTEDTTPPYSP